MLSPRKHSFATCHPSGISPIHSTPLSLIGASESRPLVTTSEMTERRYSARRSMERSVSSMYPSISAVLAPSQAEMIISLLNQSWY